MTTWTPQPPGAIDAWIPDSEYPGAGKPRRICAPPSQICVPPSQLCSPPESVYTGTTNPPTTWT